MHAILLPHDFDDGRLRRLRSSDLAVFQAYRSLPELGRYQGWTPMAQAEALRFLDEMHRAPLFRPGNWVQLGIADRWSDVLIGDIGLYVHQSGTSGEIGFTLRPDFQGRGIATRAVVESLHLFFSATSVSEVLGITDRRNLRSIKLLERVGFRFIASRQTVFRGEPCTEMTYALRRLDCDGFEHSLWLRRPDARRDGFPS